MSDQTDFVVSNVLHIAADGTADGAIGGAADTVNALAATDGFCVETCGDVYRGLARLLRMSADQFRAVIVCLDGLGAAEFEFFAVVSRLRPRVPVYVYGRAGSKARIERAIRLGASAPVTDEVMRRLSEAETVPSSPAPAPCEPVLQAADEIPPVQSVADEDVLDLHRSKAPAPIMGESDQPIDRQEETVEENEDARGDSVRVPWLRHHDGPVRQGPRSDRSAASEAVESVARRSTSTEPLLTAEELEALLGDDIAAIAPNLRVSPISDEHDGVGELP